MLKRHVNGRDVVLSAEEETALRAEWSAWTPPAPPTNDELIDLAGPVMVAFLRAYAQREGLTLRQVRDAIIAEL